LAVLRLARALVALLALLAVARTVAAHHTGSHKEEAPVKWSIHATVIESVNGPWPCSHQAMTPGAACRYSRVLRVERGEVGSILLAGTKLWMAGERIDGSAPDLHEWGVIAFDPSVMLEQQTALLTIVRALYPVEYATFTVGAPHEIEWSETETTASARAGNGSVAELMLTKDGAPALPPAPSAGPRYGTVVRVERIVPMRSELQAYRDGPKTFDLGGGSGFVATFDLSSEEVARASPR